MPLKYVLGRDWNGDWGFVPGRLDDTGPCFSPFIEPTVEEFG